EAWRVLLANRVRSLLTMAGLIIGVGAVIAIQVLGTSMSGAVSGALGSLADNSFVVFPNTRQRDVSKSAIHLRDLAAIQESIPGIEAAEPLGFVNELIRAGHVQARFGLSPDGAVSFTNLPTIYGRHFTNDDISGATNVTVISNDAYTKLFPDGGDPTGSSIYAGSHRYLIVGVLQAPKRGFINAQFSGDVLVPWPTYVHDYLRGTTIFGAGFIVKDASQIPQLELDVQKKLIELRGNTAGLEYQSFDKAKFTQGVGGIFTAMTLVVALIGAVSMLVAGIGIMNIMLVSVAERTREIGVRKAIGARSFQVLMQFFLEALLLCGTGCMVGLAIGLTLGSIVNNLFIIKVTGTVTPVPWISAIGIAVAFAVIVTLAFGTYPAYRAAKLDPIEALRYE
ncbi:MAG: ABC transporter permease, partial [Candidatus Eremiobacteraeota bacterium]|nr:ABC transporter permease [Candidatus Eremiobacteraeota bacterium]